MPALKHDYMRYTKEEDDAIVAIIKTDPFNIKRALEVASRMLGTRSYGSVAQRYYNYIRHARPVFVIHVDSKPQMANTKTLPRRSK